MSLPPAVLALSVARAQRRPVRLWLPLFLLWPLALVLGAVALAFAAVADAALFVAGRRYHHYTVLLVKSLAALGDARGTVVHVRNETSAVDLTVR
jgi:hypothetical protein